jgi:hypothetical protein
MDQWLLPHRREKSVVHHHPCVVMVAELGCHRYVEEVVGRIRRCLQIHHRQVAITDHMRQLVERCIGPECL